MPMKTSKKSIEKFLEPRKMAIAGVSRDPKKFGYTVFKELKSKGYQVYPINPNVDQVNGEPCFHAVSALPLDVRNLLIITPKTQTMQVVKEALEKGIDNIWIQQMSETREVLDYLKDKELTLVFKECIMMWTEPVRSIHKFHRSIRNFFGMLPK